MIRSRLTLANPLGVTIRLPFDERANATRARSISGTSRTLIGTTSIPSDGATAWITPNWAGPVGMVGSRRTATRVTLGAELRPRQHYLSDAEIRTLWLACDGLDTYGKILKVLLLTGLRR